MMNFIVKPTSFHCNMACRYCFYLEKAAFMDKKFTLNPHFMQPVQVKEFIARCVKSVTDHQVSLIWQGGEPLLAGLDFYRNVVQISDELEHKYGKKIYHSIQSNGTLITAEWAKFFKHHRFLIGVSIDGDRELHDVYRRTKEDNTSFNNVIRGIESLKKADVEFNTLTTVNNINVHKPLQVYQFLKSLDVKFMQFIPIVETLDLDKEHKPSWFEQPDIVPKTTDFSVSPIDYGKFIVTIFHEWVRNDITKVSIRLFDSLIAQFSGHEATLCTFREECGGENLALEVDGDIYQCDHFVYPAEKFLIGNLQTSSLQLLREKSAEWSIQKRDISSSCRKCVWLSICHGGCPKHRFVPDDASGRKSYFCDGYRYIFEQLTPGLNLIVEFLERKIPWEHLPEAIDAVYTKRE